MSETPTEDPTGLSCFLDQVRVCGADCAAYQVMAQEPNRVPCLLLVSVTKLVESAAKIRSQVNLIQEKMRL